MAGLAAKDLDLTEMVNWLSVTPVSHLSLPTHARFTSEESTIFTGWSMDYDVVTFAAANPFPQEQLKNTLGTVAISTQGKWDIPVAECRGRS